MKCPVCNATTPKSRFGEYLKCTKCISIFVKIPPKKSIQQIRADNDADIMLSNKNEETQINIARLKRLEKFILKKSKILDVGCGYGSFLKIARTYSHKPFAMDISSKLISHMRKNGINGYTGLDLFSEKSMDVVTSFDVIEHITNPQKFIKEIKRILKDDGILMITTPNLLGISGTILKSKWWVAGPDGHFILFSPKSLRILLEKNDFEILQIQTDMFTQWFTPNKTVISKILNKFLFLSFSPFQRYAYLNLLGDNIEIVARYKKH